MSAALHSRFRDDDGVIAWHRFPYDAGYVDHAATGPRDQMRDARSAIIWRVMLGIQTNDLGGLVTPRIYILRVTR